MLDLILTSKNLLQLLPRIHPKPVDYTYNSGEEKGKLRWIKTVLQIVNNNLNMKPAKMRWCISFLFYVVFDGQNIFVSTKVAKHRKG